MVRVLEPPIIERTIPRYEIIKCGRPPTGPMLPVKTRIPPLRPFWWSGGGSGRRKWRGFDWFVTNPIVPAFGSVTQTTPTKKKKVADVVMPSTTLSNVKKVSKKKEVPPVFSVTFGQTKAKPKAKTKTRRRGEK